MRNPFPFPHREGIHSRQAHCDFPKEGGYEREVSREGFFGAASHMHHQHPPTGWIEWEGPLKPRAYYLKRLENDKENPWNLSNLLYNNSCKIRFWECQSDMPFLVRNADGDDILFIHDGSGDLFCDYGHLKISEGDYIVIPRNCNWRIEVESSLSILMIEATNTYYTLPDKGMVGHHAIFDPAMLDVPSINEQFKDQQNENECDVIIKRGTTQTTVTYPFNPLDAVGWHGNAAPVRINWRDIRPLMSHRYHLPPSAHTTFLADRFVVCTFVPRPFEADPGALKVPFYHNNDDYDEVLFYHQGDFFSRDNIEPGMITHHPTGFPHGPHPKAYENSMKNTKKETDEVAVMVDTRDGLETGETMEDVEWTDYVYSWKQ